MSLRVAAWTDATSVGQKRHSDLLPAADAFLRHEVERSELERLHHCRCGMDRDATRLTQASIRILRTEDGDAQAACRIICSGMAGWFEYAAVLAQLAPEKLMTVLTNYRRDGWRNSTSPCAQSLI
jgi:hypothetical protein